MFLRSLVIMSVVQICKVQAGEHQSACVGGAVRALIDFDGKGMYAFQYCAAVDDASMRSECFRLARQHLQWAYGMGATEIREQCHASAPDALSDCRGTSSFWGRLLSFLR